MTQPTLRMRVCVLTVSACFLLSLFRSLCFTPRPSHTPPHAGVHLPALLLRHSMSALLDTLVSYFQGDVVESCWAELAARLRATRDFETLRLAHEEYLNTITTQCFLRDRVRQLFLHQHARSHTHAHADQNKHKMTPRSAVLEFQPLFFFFLHFLISCFVCVSVHVQIVFGALNDVLDTCLLFCRCYPCSAATFARLSGDYARQVCFLFSLLSRKTDFVGGGGAGGSGASFRLHGLVTRLDFNGHLSRLSASLGLGLQRHAHTKLVPATQTTGTVTSARAIANSLAATAGSDIAASGSIGSSSNYTSSSSSSSSYPKRPTSFTSTATAAGPPAHLAASSLVNQFAAGSTRPTSTSSRREDRLPARETY